jgi:hypothetical protein
VGVDTLHFNENPERRLNAPVYISDARGGKKTEKFSGRPNDLLPTGPFSLKKTRMQKLQSIIKWRMSCEGRKENEGHHCVLRFIDRDLFFVKR